MGLERYRSNARATAELGLHPVPIDDAISAMVSAVQRDEGSDGRGEL